jgi:hypothetical protein
MSKASTQNIERADAYEATERLHCSDFLTGRSWPDVLSDACAAKLSLEISGFGERRLTGAEAYSYNRP